MTEIIEALTSPVWWISVVVVGILVNLVSAYIKPTIDSSMSRVSILWRIRLEREKAERTAYIEKLKSSPNERFKASFMCNRSMQHSIHFMIIGVFAMIFFVQVIDLVEAPRVIWLGTRIFAFGFAAFCFMASYYSFLGSINRRIALFSAIDELDEGNVVDPR